MSDSASLSRKGMIDQLRAIETLAFQIIGVVAAAILIYALSLWSKQSAHIFALCITVMLAGALSGGLLGFLFGIPRLLRQPESLAATSAATEAQRHAAADRSATAFRSFAGNTNLEEISDWLTKIIVGLGLVEAKKIYDLYAAVTSAFIAQMQNAPGSGAMFVAISLVSSVGGFLFFYIQTRTRITLLLSDADVAAGELPIGDKDRQQATSAPLRAALPKEASAVTDGEEPALSDADKKFLALPFEQLKTAEDFGAWSAAQARAGNTQAAVRGLQEAISRQPNEPKYLSMLAEVRLRQNNPRAAIDAIGEVRAKTSDDPALLRQELLASLYLTPPDSFNHALQVGGILLSKSPDAAADPMVHLWLAAAYGQKFDWLKRNSGAAPEMSETRAKALDEIKEVIRLAHDPSSAPRQILVDIFQNTSASGDNDLVVFREDPDFLAVIRPDAEGEEQPPARLAN